MNLELDALHSLVHISPSWQKKLLANRIDHRLITSPEKANKKNSAKFFPTAIGCNGKETLQSRDSFLKSQTQSQTINKILWSPAEKMYSFEDNHLMSGKNWSKLLKNVYGDTKATFPTDVFEELKHSQNTWLDHAIHQLFLSFLPRSFLSSLSFPVTFLEAIFYEPHHWLPENKNLESQIYAIQGQIKY